MNIYCLCKKNKKPVLFSAHTRQERKSLWTCVAFCWSWSVTCSSVLLLKLITLSFNIKHLLCWWKKSSETLQFNNTSNFFWQQQLQTSVSGSCGSDCTTFTRNFFGRFSFLFFHLSENFCVYVKSSFPCTPASTQSSHRT